MPDSNHEIGSLKPPLDIERLSPVSAAQQLYETYTERISSFPRFRQRPFTEAQADFTATIHDANIGLTDFARDIVHKIIDRDSLQGLVADLSSYWEQYELEKGLESYSYGIVTNHRFFSDLPILAMAVDDARKHDPLAPQRSIMVLGKMIPGMEVDLERNGKFAAVTPLIQMIARQVQTVPKPPKSASKEMRSQREVWNEEAKAILEAIASTPGNIMLEAASGTHDQPVGDKLVMKRVNNETARLLCNPRLKIIPCFFSCDSFSPEGLVAAEAKYKFLPPRVLHSTTEVNETMHEIAEAGTEVLANEFTGGVEYEVPLREKGLRAGKALLSSLAHERTDSEPY